MDGLIKSGWIVGGWKMDGRWTFRIDRQTEDRWMNGQTHELVDKG